MNGKGKPPGAKRAMHVGKMMSLVDTATWELGTYWIRPLIPSALNQKAKSPVSTKQKSQGTQLDLNLVQALWTPWGVQAFRRCQTLAKKLKSDLLHLGVPGQSPWSPWRSCSPSWQQWLPAEMNWPTLPIEIRCLKLAEGKSFLTSLLQARQKGKMSFANWTQQKACCWHNGKD